MDQQQIIFEMERRAREAGVSMRQACAEAGIHPSTFCRWKQTSRNTHPKSANLRSLGKIDAALNRLAAAASDSHRLRGTAIKTLAEVAE